MTDNERKETISALRQLLAMCPFTDQYGDSIDADPFFDAVEIAIESLNNTRWIPVSERFPKSGEYCLVAWVYQHEECCPCPYQHYYGLSSFDTDIPGWDTLGKDDNEIDILAWMPLPEPWRDGEEE